MTSKKTDALHQSIDQHEQDIKDLAILKENHIQLMGEAHAAKSKSHRLNQEFNSQCTSAFGFDVKFPLTDSQRERLEPASTECDKAKQHADELEKSRSEMSLEIEVLIKRINEFYHKTSAAEVFAYQQEIDTAENVLADLRKRVVDQGELEASIHRTEEQVKKLQVQRENLLADIATGDADEAKLQELDQKIKRVSQVGEAGEIDRSRVKQTVTGLNRKVALAKEKLNSLESKKKSVIGQYIHTLIRSEAEEYLTNA